MITITHTTGIPIVECDHEDITLADYMCTIGYAPPRYPLPTCTPARITNAVVTFCAITMTGGISWTWAEFLTENDAIAFDRWCNNNNYETRGVYAPSHNCGWAVRFR